MADQKQDDFVGPMAHTNAMHVHNALFSVVNRWQSAFGHTSGSCFSDASLPRKVGQYL